MRAEAQAHVDKIKAALALLRRFLDWDRALRRLDELNARVEDPTLWNDAKAAQDVMRERRRLDARVELVEPAQCAVPIEEPAQQRQRCLDLVDMSLRFGAHGSNLSNRSVVIPADAGVFCLKPFARGLRSRRPPG
jgi:hypothetical protein